MYIDILCVKERVESLVGGSRIGIVTFRQICRQRTKASSSSIFKLGVWILRIHDEKRKVTKGLMGIHVDKRKVSNGLMGVGKSLTLY